MSIKKIQTMDMYLQKVALYSTYVDCLSMVIREFIENGDDNINPSDLPNLSVLLSKMSYRLRLNILNMKDSWEFSD